jgi:ribosomal protein S18 acetylase RimI-like enzyme
MPEIRDYQKANESAWLRCRVLAFLETPYFDDVLTEKPRYAGSAIELVAFEDGALVGLVDVEVQETSDKHPKIGVIWNLAVHPDFQGRGIGRRLLEFAMKRASQLNIGRFEAWTRDDPVICAWYESHHFELVDQYLHVYLNQQESFNSLTCSVPDMIVLKAFAQYTGNDSERIRRRFDRTYECRRYVLDFEKVDAAHEAF